MNEQLDDDELVPGHPNFERALAQGQFEFAKTRYIRTLATSSTENVIQAAARTRAKLTDEIKNLQVLSRTRYETARDAARAYARVLPHRVGKTWLQPPAALERVGEFYGSDKLYKVAAKAAKEFAEAQNLLAKKHDELTALERTLRQRLDSHEAEAQRALRTEAGLANALQRDPLLKIAYQHLKAASREETFKPYSFESENSQFPNEPVA